MYHLNKPQNAESKNKHSASNGTQSSHKTDNVVCIECGALKHNGKWTWDPLPNNFEDDYCPACLKIKDGMPAGSITLSGKYTIKNREALVNLINSIAAEETSRHPLERLIDIEYPEGQIRVTTTGDIMPRLIGYTLNLQYHGTLETISTGQDDLIHFLWKRDT